MLVTLDYIVNNWLRQREYSDHWYMRGLGYAVDVVKQLKEDNILSAIVQTEVVELNEYGVGELPAGLLEAVCISDSRSIAANPKYGVSRPDLIEGLQISSGLVPYNQLKYHYLSGRLWAWQPYQQGFAIDHYRRELRVSGWAGDSGAVILQYIANHFCSDCSKIHQYAEEAIIAYINWQNREQGRTYGDGQAERYEQKYMQARNKLFRKMPRGKWGLDSIKAIFDRPTGPTLASPILPYL